MPAAVAGSRKSRDLSVVTSNIDLFGRRRNHEWRGRLRLLRAIRWFPARKELLARYAPGGLRKLSVVAGFGFLLTWHFLSLLEKRTRRRAAPPFSAIRVVFGIFHFDRFLL